MSASYCRPRPESGGDNQESIARLTAATLSHWQGALALIPVDRAVNGVDLLFDFVATDNAVRCVVHFSQISKW